MITIILINSVSLGQSQCLPRDRQQVMQSSEMPGPEFPDCSYVGKFFSNFGPQILEKYEG